MGRVILLVLALALLVAFLVRPRPEPDPQPVRVVTTSAATVPPMPPAATSQPGVTMPTTVVRLVPTARTAPTDRVGADVWWRIAMCETGGTMNPRAYNPAGPYYGYFQFDVDSWRSAGGGPGLPWDYSYDEQRAVAQRWQQLVGWDAWPTCAPVAGAA